MLGSPDTDLKDRGLRTFRVEKDQTDPEDPSECVQARQITLGSLLRNDET